VRSTTNTKDAEMTSAFQRKKVPPLDLTVKTYSSPKSSSSEGVGSFSEELLPSTPCTVKSHKGTELHRLVTSLDAKKVKDWLASQLTLSRLIDRKDEHGFTALLKASALAGNVGTEIASLLLDHKANLHIRDPDGYTALHWASACGHLGTLKRIIKAIKDPQTPPMPPPQSSPRGGHMSMLLGSGMDEKMAPPAMSPLILSMKPIVPTKPKLRDERSFTKKAHLASPALGSQGAKDYERALNARSNEGETPLMRASRLGQTTCIKALLHAKANPFLRNIRGESAMDIAGVFQKRCNKKRRAYTRGEMLKANHRLGTLVLHHPDCLRHAGAYLRSPVNLKKGKRDKGTKPEGTKGNRKRGFEVMEKTKEENSKSNGASKKRNRRRLELQDLQEMVKGSESVHSILDMQSPLSSSVPTMVTGRNPPQPLPQVNVDPNEARMKVAAGWKWIYHQESPERIFESLPILNSTGFLPTGEVRCLSNFEKASPGIIRLAHADEYVRMVMSLGQAVRETVPFTPQVQKVMQPNKRLKAADTCDTLFSPGSLDAALRASGAVKTAIDAVVEREAVNAFCLVRPPGHHAGVKGLLQRGKSCGFCIFNSVAIGALYALKYHRREIKKVAIVDLDVHHGNGTEDILIQRGDPEKIFFTSIHIYSNSPGEYYFYPGSGEKGSLLHNHINIPVDPLWKGSAASRPSSSHQNGCSSGKDTDEEDSQQRHNHSSRERMTRRGDNADAGRHAWRAKVQNILLPAVRAFNPDLILISAGFDGAKYDVGNSQPTLNRTALMGLDLEPLDFEWATQKIQMVANICCQGRVVSVLEGGYGCKQKRQKSGSLSSRSPKTHEQSKTQALQTRCSVRNKANNTHTSAATSVSSKVYQVSK